MDTLNETQILTNVGLQDTDKFILAKLSQNQPSHLEYLQTLGSRKLIVHREQLAKVGLITLDDNQQVADITDKGREALKAEGILDDTGNLTPEGEKYANANNLEDLAKVISKEKSATPPAPNTEPRVTANQPTSVAAPEQETGQADLGLPEAWSMISLIQEELNQKEFLKKHKKY
jgi:predicted transcriptional regulator